MRISKINDEIKLMKTKHFTNNYIIIVLTITINIHTSYIFITALNEIGKNKKL